MKTEFLTVLAHNLDIHCLPSNFLILYDTAGTKHFFLNFTYAEFLSAFLSFSGKDAPNPQ